MVAPLLASMKSSTNSGYDMLWARLVVFGVIVFEAILSALIQEYAIVNNFEVPQVYAQDLSVAGNNSELSYPIYLGGARCTATTLRQCTTLESTVCCVELFDPDGSGPGEAVTTLQLFAYALVIPALLLVMRGFLLGRVWSRFSSNSDASGSQIPHEIVSLEWVEGDTRDCSWHIRVGFYSVDAVLGLLLALVNAYTWTEMLKVLVGRPRPNYHALQAFTELGANGEDFTEESVLSFPSGHASFAMAGMVFLAYVIWMDVYALVKWRRRAHPGLTLALAIVMGFAVLLLPLAAVAIGITRIQDYWHRPDDVIAGMVIGGLSAHWAFRLVVLFPFEHERGSLQVKPKFSVPSTATTYTSGVRESRGLTAPSYSGSGLRGRRDDFIESSA